jgi:hypothetical protein
LNSASRTDHFQKYLTVRRSGHRDYGRWLGTLRATKVQLMPA